MFKNFFNRFKKEKQESSAPSNPSLFKKLFPISAENKEKVESRIYDLFEQMHGKEGLEQMKNYSRKYTVKATKFNRLNFDSLG